MKKVFLSLMLAAGLTGLSIGQTTQQSSHSQKDNESMKQQDKNAGWEKIGEKTVNLSDKRGIFNWNTDREKTINANEKYSAIKFKAKDATVHMTDVEVAYENGKTQNLGINTPVMVNSESKVVPLQASDKLDKITFNFRKDESASADKAKIELWGLKADKSSGMGTRDRDIMDEDKDLDHSRTDRSKDMDRSDRNKDKDLDNSRSNSPRSTP